MNSSDAIRGLPIGTEFIIVSNKVLPVAGLAGERTGGFFYPAGSESGYLVRIRHESGRERYDALRRRLTSAEARQ